MNKQVLHLFSAFGIEMEYMIVDRNTLNIKPIADDLIYQLVKSYANEVDLGMIAISNELVLHVIELKTNGPNNNLINLHHDFHKIVTKLNQQLLQFNAQLMPTGAHPWMEPLQETKLWPHGDSIIYETYHQIFTCEGHGWSNLQSTHLNLPFANDKEFSQLHTAIRLLLPIIPALTASTPIIAGKVTNMLDTRLSYYGKNQQKIPEISGEIIPEYVTTRDEYEQQILQPMYHAIAPYDPKATLQDEWLNSRAAIARFDRNAIEIRILDIQECPLADLACIEAIVAVLCAMVNQKWMESHEQGNFSCSQLRKIFDQVIKTGFSVRIEDPLLLRAFGYVKNKTCRVNDLWYHLLEQLGDTIPVHYTKALEVILLKGNLASRIIHALEKDSSHQTIKHVYHRLMECLQENCLLEQP